MSVAAFGIPNKKRLTQKILHYVQNDSLMSFRMTA